MNGQVAGGEAAEVVIRCEDDPSVQLRLFDRYYPDQYGVGFSIEAQADNLRASVGAEVWVWDETGLAEFLAGLAADFRGWDGERGWSTNHFAVRAVFRSRGHVSLTWSLRQWSSRSDSWEASVTTSVEAGEQMASLAAGVREFLRFNGRAALH
jgi:hypothetical protein